MSCYINSTGDPSPDDLAGVRRRQRGPPPGHLRSDGAHPARAGPGEERAVRRRPDVRRRPRRGLGHHYARLRNRVPLLGRN